MILYDYLRYLFALDTHTRSATKKYYCSPSVLDMAAMHADRTLVHTSILFFFFFFSSKNRGRATSTFLFSTLLCIKKGAGMFSCSFRQFYIYNSSWTYIFITYHYQRVAGRRFVAFVPYT